jgi:putative Mg2+ transporter-C (MgtC) family protein
VLTLGALSLFRVVEFKLPSQSYAHHYVRFARSVVMPEEELKRLLAAHGFSVANMSYRITDDDLFEYRMVMRTLDPANASRLAEVLRLHPSVREFRISPTGDTQL